MTIIGFTGTRKGMTAAQLATLRNELDYYFTEAHHGDCIGADAEFHALVQNHFKRPPVPKIVIHPPDNPRYRNFSIGGIVLPEKPYLVRNRDIVLASNHILAAPREFADPGYGGTWWTIRYCEDQDKALTIIFPNGKVTQKNLYNLTYMIDNPKDDS